MKRTGEQCVSVSLAELLSLSRNAKQISLTRSQKKMAQAGQNFSRLLGRGMEFAESRRYHPGDESRNIDWRVTARTGKPYTKLFTEEKERQILLCVDMRSPMFFATRGVFKSVQATLMSGLIAWRAAQTGNRLGGLIFDESNHFEFRPALGKRGILPFLQCLAEKCKLPLKAPTKKSMDHAIENIKRVAAPGSLVLIFSDFRGFSLEAHDMLLELSKHSDLRLCFLYDHLEESLPKNGLYPITDGFYEVQLNTHDGKSLEKYRENFLKRKELLSAFQLMECTTQDDCFDKLREYFR